MPRNRRVWIPEYFYHIVCRGNRRDPLFREDSDFRIFLYLLQHVNKAAPFELASYCLMTNHFHLLLRSKNQPTSKVMSLINKRYADYFNNKYDLTGHVFEKRYFDKLIGDRYGVLRISQYIHLNPVEAGIVQKAEMYRWSSYRYYLYTADERLLSMNTILESFPGGELEKRELYRQFTEGEDIRLEMESEYK
ncbi:transposase [Ornithinibacillus sp. L9]|uniref:Transposase n=1 Tax=Ornithinibacillus caprae TaxID=2678566 RepID=A0A6N8FDU8_9BACI|nr:transposase [Ornithinibacillus caprae]MUK87700.1 transposase [Ornithinibacillus caprae]